MKNFNGYWVWKLWIIPFEDYVFNISLALFSLPQLKASCSFELVKFSFTGILKFGIPIPDSSKFLNFVRSYRVCLQHFWFTNFSMAFVELYLDSSMRWQLPVLFWKIWTSAAPNASITECPRFLFPILSGMPIVSMFFYDRIDPQNLSLSQELWVCVTIVSLKWAFLRIMF